MFRIASFISVVICVVVQSQDFPYLRSSAQGSPLLFLCVDYPEKVFGDPFQCDSVYCIPPRYLCDSVVDCPNFVDEDPAYCAAIWPDYCNEVLSENNGKDFYGDICHNGMCITECDVCDGEFLDCADFSDELNCSGRPGPDPERCADY